MSHTEEGVTFPEPLTCQAFCLELYTDNLITPQQLWDMSVVVLSILQARTLRPRETSDCSVHSHTDS